MNADNEWQRGDGTIQKKNFFFFFFFMSAEDAWRWNHPEEKKILKMIILIK